MLLLRALSAEFSDFRSLPYWLETETVDRLESVATRLEHLPESADRLEWVAQNLPES